MKIYIDYAFYETTYLLTIYAKGDKEDLSQAERNNLKKLVKLLESGSKRRM